MRNHVSLLSVSAALVVSAFSFTALADEPSVVGNAPGTGQTVSAVAPKTSAGLTRVHGGITAEGDRSAGQSRDVGLDAGGRTVTRPVPTPRMLRKLEVERFVASIDAGVKACVSENPSIYASTFALAVSVAPSGSVEGSQVTTGRVAPAVLACVTKAVAAGRFGAPGASGALVTIPVSVPGKPQGPSVPRTTTTVTVTQTSTDDAKAPAQVAVAEAKPTADAQSATGAK